MIKVTVIAESPRAHVCVEGAVDLVGAAELHLALEDSARPSATGRIDLAGVTSVDGAGATLLRTLQADGWELANASLYIAMLLQESQSCPGQP